MVTDYRSTIHYPQFRTKPSAYLRACFAVAACALLCHSIRSYVDHSNLVMILLLGVAWSAARYGRGPSIYASVCSVAIFDFFFVEPYFSWTVANSQYLLTFAVMLIIAILISTLTARVKQQAELAAQRERNTYALYSLSQALSSLKSVEEILHAAEEHFRTTFVCGVKTYIDPRDEATEGKTLKELQSSSSGCLVEQNKLLIALNGTKNTLGFMELLKENNDVWSFENDEALKFLQTFASQFAMAIECCQMADQAEFEKLRNTLLSSVSHDVRTPLATITGAASSLLESSHLNNMPREHELATVILEESQRLDAYVRNILSMTRLQAGAIQLRKEVQPLEEVVGAALTRLDEQLSQRTITTDLSETLPLVSLDAVLMEQVFLNLLDNAVKFSEQGDSVNIAATVRDDQVLVSIHNTGVGIKQGEEIKIFEKYFRSADTDSSVFGAGLGLAICRGIVEAHGGKIWAEPPNGRGATFSFTLPLAQITTDQNGGNCNVQN